MQIVKKTSKRQQSSSPSLSNPKGIASTLLKFLRNEKVSYKPLKAKIVNTQPLQITDDGHSYIDCLNLQQTLGTIESESDNIVLDLKKWKFVFKKVPGNDECYFDVEASEYEVLEEEMGEMVPEDEEDSLKNVMEIPEVKYYFEVKKRALLSGFYKNAKVISMKMDFLGADGAEKAVSGKKGRGKKGSKMAQPTVVRLIYPDWFFLGFSLFFPLWRRFVSIAYFLGSCYTRMSF